MLGKSFDALFKQKFVGVFFSPVKRISVHYFDLKEFFVCFFEVFFFNQCSRHGSSYSNAGLSFHYLFGPLVWFRIKYFNNFRFSDCSPMAVFMALEVTSC